MQELAKEIIEPYQIPSWKIFLPYLKRLNSRYPEKAQKIFLRGLDRLSIRKLVSKIKDAQINKEDDDEHVDYWRSIRDGEDLEGHLCLARHTPENQKAKGILNDLYNSVLGLEDESDEYLRDYHERQRKLTHDLSLTEEESSLIGLFFIMSKLEGISRFIRDVLGYTCNGAREFLACCIGVEPEKVSTLLATDEKLTRLALLIFKDDSIHEISPDVDRYLSGVKTATLLDDLATLLEVREILKPDRIIPDRLQVDLVRHCLSKPEGSNILLYGKAGTGKTSLVASLAKEVRRPVYSFKTPKDGVEGRLLIFFAIAPKNAILLIDEADKILNSGFSIFGNYGQVNKGWLNENLETHGRNIVWVTNERWGIEESVLRRMNCIHEFKSRTGYLESEEIEKQAAEVLDENFLCEESMEMLKRLDLGPALRKNIFNTFKGMELREPKQQNRLMEHMISQYKKLMPIQEARHHCSRKEDTYSISGLNMDTDPQKILSVSKSFIGGRTQVDRLSLLLYGPPGTGKTEFVKFLARDTMSNLISKKASDLISPLLGSTERKLAAAFEEATEKESILFIDEADSFLQDRGSAHRSWEVTQVNELLVQMENFRGLLIMGTNFENIIDEAATRRFDLRVKFGPILQEKIEDVLSLQFPSLGQNSDTHLKNELRSFTDLRFGDIRNVLQRLKIGLIDESSTTIINELRKECSSRQVNQTIGF